MALKLVLKFVKICGFQFLLVGLCVSGADIILNLSASNETVAKDNIEEI